MIRYSTKSWRLVGSRVSICSSARALHFGRAYMTSLIMITHPAKQANSCPWALNH